MDVRDGAKVSWYSAASCLGLVQTHDGLREQRTRQYARNASTGRKRKEKKKEEEEEKKKRKRERPLNG
jgi:hypothetical protein